MPAISVVPVDLAVNALIKYITYFNTDKLPEHSSRVWQDISDELKGLWKVPAVRINVRQNRRKILTLAREKCGIFIQNNENISSNLNVSTASSDNSNTTNDLNDNDSDNNNEKNGELESTVSDNDDECEDFHVTITREQWNLMKHDKPFIYNGRKYYGFEPGVWTNIVSFAFWEQYRLKCAFVFKRGKINGSNNYAVMNGRCKDRSCLNSVRGIIKDPPLDDGPVVITMKCRDTRYSKHADVKRPLNGKKRKEVQPKLLRSGVLGWRKEEAKTILKPGDTGSSFLYNSSTLHQAKKEATDEELGIHSDDRRDMILAIRKMNQDPSYVNSILWIGDSPFFVFYATPTQFHTYAEYRRIHKQHSSIEIDATGGLVKKLSDSRDKKTGHIFLYQIVINFDHTSIPVYQMLSEKHSAKFIAFWLSEWAEKVNLPQQAVSDGSRALLNAMSVAFNGKSLKDYINFMFESVTTSANLQPRTFIRLDAAHFLHAVSSWKCFQTALHKIVKSFFLYCVALMIDCEELSNLEEIFMMTLIVCSTEFEDTIIAMGDRVMTPGEARKYLEELVAKRNPDLTVIDSVEVDPDKTVILEELSSKATNDNGWSVALVTWIENLCKKVNTTIFIGQKLNTHYVPGLYADLVDKMKDFPLWTKVCTPKTMSRPTSCYVETDFKDLKMNLRKKVKLPTTVNKFLKLHIADILGGVNIFRSKLTKFVVDNSSNEYQKKSKEENEYENWKGFGKNETATDYDWATDYGNVPDQVEHNDSATVSENPIDLVEDTNLAEKNIDQNDSVTAFNIGDDHNYSSISIQEKHEDSNINTSIINEKINSSDEELSFKHKTNQNDSVVSLEDQNDSSDNRNFDEDKNYCLDISITSVENHETIDVGLLNTDFQIVTVTSTDSLDDSISNLSSSTIYLDNDKKNTHEFLTVKQDSDPLSLAIENMMKQKMMKKKNGHYFQKCPEVALLNNLVDDEKSEGTKKRKDFLLRNGNKTGPVKFKGIKWTALNTCPFDSIVQIIFTAAIDNTHYRHFINNSDLSIFKFVKSFIKTGATQEIYEQRMAILHPIFDTKKLEENSLKINLAPYINCQDNVIKLWEKLHEAAPSVIETTSCSNSLCQIYTQTIPAISANHRIITRHGFKALEKALQFYHKIFNVRCPFCFKAMATRVTVPQKYLFIELDVRDEKRGPRGKRCKLSELPLYLNLQLENSEESKTNLRYRISGVVAFIEGHYLAYCRRLGGNWQEYNDLSIKPESVSDHAKVELHAVFYILE